MRAFTKGYIERNNLFSDVRQYTDVSCEFMASCTPPKLGPTELETTCLFMLVFLLLNDFRRSHTEALGGLGEGLLEVLSTGDAGRCPYPRYVTCFSDFVERVEAMASANALSMHRFRERMSRTIRAFVWEDEALRSAQQIDKKAYFDHRTDLVGNLTSLETNRICAGYRFEDFDDTTASRLSTLEQLSTQMVYLSNDIVSFSREISEGKRTNLVSIISREQGRSIAESLAEVRSLHDQAALRFLEVRQSIGEAGPEVDAYVEMIEIDTSGNIEGMLRLRERY